MDVFEGRQPEIAYPCPWNFRIIGTSHEAIRVVVAEVVGEAEHDLQAANASASGKYVSMHLTVTVVDEEHRLAVYQGISAAACVKMVL